MDSNGEAFEKKRFFAWVAGHQGDAAAKVSKKGESFGVDGTKSLASDWNEGVSSWYLAFFFSPALSAAPPI